MSLDYFEMEACFGLSEFVNLARYICPDMGKDDSQPRQGFAIFIETLFEGRVPLWRDGDNKPFFYATQAEAERDIAEDLIQRLQDFLKGEREFEEAMTVEEYILPVERLPDGSVVTEDGGHFH